MEDSLFSKTDPLIVLLNEIEILLTQTRLLELHVKRAESLAADRLAQLHEEHQRELAALRAEWAAREKTPAGGEGIDSGRMERSDLERENTALHCRLAELEVVGEEARRRADSELEKARRGFASELAALRHQLAAKERELAGRHEAVTGVELALHGKVHILQQELARLRQEIAERDRALEQARGEVAALRHSEGSAAAAPFGDPKNSFHDDRGPSRAGPGKEHALLAAKVAELQLSLAEKQLLAECRATEIADLKETILRLEQRFCALDADVVPPQALARRSGALQSRRDARADEDSIPSQENFAMDETTRERPGPGADAQSSVPQTPSEQALRDEILRLRQQAQETNRILQDRNDELVRVKLQMDQLQERLAALESAASNEAPVESETERMHTEFQAQLALLQAELSQKEWEFEERQAKAHSLEQRLRGDIEGLRKQMSELQKPDGDPARQAAAAGNGSSATTPPGLFARQRRWRHGFESKRRWRS